MCLGDENVAAIVKNAIQDVNVSIVARERNRHEVERNFKIAEDNNNNEIKPDSNESETNKEKINQFDLKSNTNGINVDSEFKLDETADHENVSRVEEINLLGRKQTERVVNIASGTMNEESLDIRNTNLLTVPSPTESKTKLPIVLAPTENQISSRPMSTNKSSLELSQRNEQLLLSTESDQTAITLPKNLSNDLMKIEKRTLFKDNNLIVPNVDEIYVLDINQREKNRILPTFIGYPIITQ